ncbi:MAG: beta-lactamase family protein [Lewinellaceae bacterium]|nr:beta-lactamase family protein [Lewinellaceae bacterium]
MKYFFLFTLGLLLGLTPQVSGQIGQLSPLQKKILDSLATQDVPSGAPGIATAIIHQGALIYQRCAGYANLTDSTLITPQTRFNIASNGKQFTALAILILADKKKLHLTDDIRKYFPALYPDIQQKITLENLLTHTSGIRDVYDLWSLQGITWWEKTFDNTTVITLLQNQRDLNFEPGSQYLYSNTNYILLAAVIEKVTGKSFAAFTRTMFQALHMPNTSFVDDYTAISGSIAKPYFNFNTWTTYAWIWNVCGDGNLFSTLADQWQWEQLLQGKGKTTIKRTILARSQQLANSTLAKNYGFGLEFDTYKGFNYRFHEGATGAWKAITLRFPHEHLAIITLVNTGKAAPAFQTRQMVDLVLGLPGDTTYFPTEPTEAGPYVSEADILGFYRGGNNFTFQFVDKEGMLFLKRLGRNDIKLTREGDNIFHQWNDPAFKQEFRKNAQGEMDVVAYYTTHAPYTLTRKNIDWTHFNYQSLEGVYVNAETQVTATIQFIAEKSYRVKINQQEETQGVLLSPTELLVNNYLLTFPANSSPVEEFRLSADRIQQVRFVRIK